MKSNKINKLTAKKYVQSVCYKVTSKAIFNRWSLVGLSKFRENSSIVMPLPFVYEIGELHKIVHCLVDNAHCVSVLILFNGNDNDYLEDCTDAAFVKV